MASCEFERFFPRETWRAYGGGPRRGAPSEGLHPMMRCPSCNRRLRMKAAYCVGGEFVCWILPAHSVRETRAKTPHRRSRISGRGK